MHKVEIPVPKGVAPLGIHLGKSRSEDFLEGLIAPLTLHDFLSQHWQQRAAAFTGGGPKRVASLCASLHRLDLQALLSASPSDAIRAWVRPVDGSRMESVNVDEATAMTLSRSGASLYFRAPQEFTDTFLPRLAKGLGANFSIYYADGALRGETETFVARKGHRTDWHTDFQENFTIQLSGTRRWRFKRQPGPGAPLRGLSQHYATMEIYEEQMKAARDVNDSIQYTPDPAFFADAEEVLISAGDVLYHPAGIWHAVECESDLAISVNFSLANQSWADVLGSGFQQSLWRSLGLRERVCGIHSSEALRAEMSARLDQAKAIVCSMTIDDLCPPALALPRVTFIAVKPRRDFTPAPRYRRSAVGVLIPLKEDAFEEDSDDEEGNVQYAFHANFGNSELESLLRVIISVPPAIVPVVEHLQRHQTVAVADLPRCRRDLLCGLLRALHFVGYLVSVSRKSLQAMRLPGRVVRRTVHKKPAGTSMTRRRRVAAKQQPRKIRI